MARKLSLLYVLPLLCTGADVSGIVRTSLPNDIVEPEKKSPPPSSGVTLCSEDRVYRVEGDRQGRFKLEKVRPGAYDLVAVARAFAPELISKLKIVDDESISSVVAIVHAGRRTSPCYVSTEGHTQLQDFDVDYEPPDSNRTTPIIQGSAQRIVHREGADDSTAPLPNAKINLFRVGEEFPVASIESNKHGEFTLYPPEPGIYELVMTRQGYHDVRVPAFLVPRENITLIELSAATADSIVIDR